MTRRRDRHARWRQDPPKGRREAPTTSRSRREDRTTERSVPRRRASATVDTKRRRPSRAFLLVLGLLIVGTTVVIGGRWILRQPYFRVQSVRLVGATHESRAAVLRVTGLDLHPELYGLSTATIERSLRVFPWLTSAQVRVSWPHTVTVTMHETHVVGVTSFRKSWAFVGANGAYLGVAPANADLPTLVDPAAGAVWPYARQGAAAVTIASSLPPAFSAQVRTINVDPTGAVSLGMTTPVIFVVGDASSLRAKFTAIASVLKSTTLTPGDVVNVTVPDELTVTSPSSG